MDNSSTLVTAGSTGERQLQAIYGTTQRAEAFYANQVLEHLNETMRAFVERQEMLFLATADSHGACDSTLRTGPAGFVRVLDAHRLVWPEYRGNGVLASLGNIVENPHVGLLFLDFTRDGIGLHVNGLAEIEEDATMRALYPDLPVDPVPGRRAERWVTVYVEEAYIHCAKHIPRMQKLPRGRTPEGGENAGKKSNYFITQPPQ
jgi:predicted pyridoxine 5'-phosphate oxidase superfamily flavin-nucleotide-binding protein